MENARQGDKVELWMVSAPYSGFSCRCREAKIMLEQAQP